MKIKTSFLLALGSLLLVGCGADKQPPIADAINKSYDITVDMNKTTAASLLKMKPTTVTRIDNKEIWKFEGNENNEETKTVTYHNLTIKFVDGKVKNIGTFSCKLPSQDK